MALPVLLAKYQGVLIRLGIVVVMIGAAWIHGCSHGAGEAEEEHAAAISAARAERIVFYEDQVRRARLANQTSQADTRELADRIGSIQEFQTDLLGAIDRTAMTIRGINRETGCPDPRLGPAVRLCYNAAVAGSPGAAADCGAVGVSTPAAPD